MGGFVISVVKIIFDKRLQRGMLDAIRVLPRVHNIYMESIYIMNSW